MSTRCSTAASDAAGGTRSREPAPRRALLAAAAAALLTDRIWGGRRARRVLLLVCLRAPASRRWPYLVGALMTGLGVFVLSPLLWSSGGGTCSGGADVPVLGPLDVSTEELATAALNGLRLVALGLAFSAYALLLDHDRLARRRDGRGGRRSRSRSRPGSCRRSSATPQGSPRRSAAAA